MLIKAEWSLIFSILTGAVLFDNVGTKVSVIEGLLFLSVLVCVIGSLLNTFHNIVLLSRGIATYNRVLASWFGSLIAASAFLVTAYFCMRYYKFMYGIILTSEETYWKEDAVLRANVYQEIVVVSVLLVVAISVFISIFKDGAKLIKQQNHQI